MMTYRNLKILSLSLKCENHLNNNNNDNNTGGNIYEEY